MSIIKSMLLFFKNIFTKKEKVKLLQEAVDVSDKEEKYKFTESLKVNVAPKKKKKKIETLVCDGSGLGIQKKICF